MFDEDTTLTTIAEHIAKSSGVEVSASETIVGPVEAVASNGVTPMAVSDASSSASSPTRPPKGKPANAKSSSKCCLVM